MTIADKSTSTWIALVRCAASGGSKKDLTRIQHPPQGYRPPWATRTEKTMIDDDKGANPGDSDDEDDHNGDTPPPTPKRSKQVGNPQIATVLSAATTMTLRPRSSPLRSTRHRLPLNHSLLRRNTPCAPRVWLLRCRSPKTRHRVMRPSRSCAC